MAVSSIPLPPPLLRERVSGSQDERQFVESGARTLAEWMRALQAVEVSLDNQKVILDFGRGRVANSKLQYPNVQLCLNWHNAPRLRDWQPIEKLGASAITPIHRLLNVYISCNYHSVTYWIYKYIRLRPHEK
jgi:hypothetical protein